MFSRLSICLLLFSVQLFGQELVLKEVEIKNGANSYLITSAAFIDKDRFVWYSTNRDGEFYRFDGNHKLRYSYFKDKAPHANSYYISHLSWAQDHIGNIWAAEPEYAYIISPDSMRVRRINYPTEKPGAETAIGIDGSQNVWVSNGSNYLIKIGPNGKTTKISHPILAQTKLTIAIIKVTNDQKILARAGDDLFVIDNNGFHFFANLKKLDKLLSPVFGIIENGEIFKKNSTGYYKHNTIPYRYTYIKSLNLHFFDYPGLDYSNYQRNYGNNNFLAIGSKLLTANGKNIYVNKIDTQKNEIVSTDTIRFKIPIAINAHKDYNNMVWISGYDELYKLMVTPSIFTRMLQLKDKKLSTRGITADARDNLYVGTYDGLYIVGPDKKVRKDLFLTDKPNDFYDCLLQEKDSPVLWAFFSGNKLRRIDLITHKSSVFDLRQYMDLNCLKEKSQNELWLGTNKGLFVFNKKNGGLKAYSNVNDPLAKLPVFDVLQSKLGTIWIATNIGLFFKKNNGSTTRYKTTNQPLNHAYILTIHEDTDGNLWMGTFNNGVIFLNVGTGQIKTYNTINGLSNNIVCGILESKKALWFSTYYGLSRFDKQKAAFTLFYKEDGLPDNEFNLRSVYRKNDNSFYFGGLNGLVEFDPEKINHRPAHPHHIFLFSASYFSKEKNSNITKYLDIGKNVIELPYNKNYFSAKFSINELFYNEKSTYSYKIDGLTNGWIDVGTLGEIELFGLPYGSHVLQVKAKDAKGIETANEIRITIDVDQVFFQTFLFKAFVFLITIGMITSFFIWKSRKQKKIFERETEIIKLRTSALKAQMNPHFLFNILNNMQSVLILKGEREVNRYFAAFSKLLRLTLDMSKQDLVSLNDELDYIKSYLLLNNLQLNNELDYSVVVESSIGDPSAIFLPGMLLQPFVENAIIHGLGTKKEKKLDIRCKIDQSYLVVEIEDNGIGRAAAAQLAKNKKDTHRSWATHIVSERISILGSNFKDKKAVTLEIQDLENDGQPTGTIVTLRFMLQI